MGEQFQLFNFGSESGNFSELDLPAPYQWDTSNLYTQGFVTVTAVPEPIGMGVFGVAGVLLGRRRK